jgi:hypothetical protein
MAIKMKEKRMGDEEYDKLLSVRPFAPCWLQNQKQR